MTLPEGSRQFEVTTAVVVKDEGDTAQLWLPLFQQDGNYQRTLGLLWEGNGRARVVRDRTSGARLLHVEWHEQGERMMRLVERVATWERTTTPTRKRLSQAERAFYTRSTAAVPTGGIVAETTRAIIGNLSDPRAQVRAIYDWVVAHAWRNPATAGCGTGDIVAMLGDGKMGGKCADINTLMVGLARAAGIPARDVYGLRLADSQLFRSLGRSGTVTGAQHCRAEVWLDDAGWFAVDPADVRKAVLEEKLAMDSEPIKALSEHLFGRWESNWAAYNTANRIDLPGTDQAAPFHFLMYPTAMTGNSAPQCLDSACFSYSIQSRELRA